MTEVKTCCAEGAAPMSFNATKVRESAVMVPEAREIASAELRVMDPAEVRLESITISLPAPVTVTFKLEEEMEEREDVETVDPKVTSNSPAAEEGAKVAPLASVMKTLPVVLEAEMVLALVKICWLEGAAPISAVADKLMVSAVKVPAERRIVVPAVMSIVVPAEASELSKTADDASRFMLVAADTELFKLRLPPSAARSMLEVEEMIPVLRLPEAVRTLNELPEPVTVPVMELTNTSTGDVVPLKNT